MNRVGRYEIVGRLGRGGMSTVYKARAPFTGRLTALKLLQPRNELFTELVGAEKLAEMFVEEARVMGSLNHDHVAKVLDCDYHEGQPFIVLEYFAHSIGSFIGESYRVESPSRIISAAKTRTYLIQALKGLERLHFAGIIHRDIKPFNLMLTSDDRVKIIDFGLSRVRGEEVTAIPGMQVGSPYYAAPEQRRDAGRVDGRADLFSLGIMGYRMLTGQLADLSQEVVPPSSVNPQLDPCWDDVILKAIARDPRQRFASAQEMRLNMEALPEFSDDAGLSVRHGTSFVLQEAEKRVRSAATRVMYKDIRTLLNLDQLMRPMSYGTPEFRVVNSLVAQDRNSGLFWQRRGSGFTLNWQQAAEYVAYLNETRWQGRDSWRLPTLEELATVLNPPVHGHEFSPWPLFAKGVHWLWSADHCTKKQAWMADIEEAFFERLDRDGGASVCAVSSR